MLAGLASLLSVEPSHAAFGDAANVFGKPTNTTGIIPYKGKGFQVDLPSKWGPSNEKEGQKNVILRYEDTGDAVNNVLIFKVKANKGSVKEYGDPAAFLNDVKGIFGENMWRGATISEGGFKKDQVSAASLIASDQEQKDGRTYYKLQVLTRTADGNEGGRHNLISATVDKGDLWICKVQIGDKRWFKGASKQGQAVYNTFTVA